MLLGQARTGHLSFGYHSRGLSTRLELRSVDPTANPYLAIAAILQAGLDGVRTS